MMIVTPCLARSMKKSNEVHLPLHVSVPTVLLEYLHLYSDPLYDLVPESIALLASICRLTQ